METTTLTTRGLENPKAVLEPRGITLLGYRQLGDRTRPQPLALQERPWGEGTGVPPIIRIADPVHGYVVLSEIERQVLNHPVSQRLRNVSQNGLAHLVYPEARGTRFTHSLGTMQLASRMLASCLRNATPEVRAELTPVFREFVTSLGDTEGITTGEEALTALNNPGVYTAHHYSDPDTADHVRLIEQALRLAALFHDLGHLPFSHDFEHAVADHHRSNTTDFKLQTYQHGEGALHEQVGHQLARLVLADLQAKAMLVPSVRHVFEAAFRILDTAENLNVLELERDPSRLRLLLAWLHSLIDGEIDADRCDYLLRDGRSFGFAFSDFDVDRLVAHLEVRKHNGVYKTVVQSPGLSSLEGFLQGRMRLYQYGIYHHKCLQVGLAFQHCVRRMLDEQSEAVSRFKEDLESLLRVDRQNMPDNVERTALLDRFSWYDDSWWRQEMRQRFSRVPEDPWFGLVLARRSGPRSLWKRRDDAPWASRGPKEFNGVARGVLSDLDDSERQQRWRDVLEEYRKKDVLVSLVGFKPWEPDKHAADYVAGDPRTYRSALLVTDRTGNVSRASEISSLVESLWDQWDGQVQLYAFAAEAVEVDPKDVVEKLARVGQDMVGSLPSQ